MNQGVQDRLALETIQAYFNLHKRAPEAGNLAAKFDVPLVMAQGWIEEFLTTNGRQRIASESHSAPTKRSSPKPKTHLIDILIDRGGLYFAMLVDLVLNGIGFWIIGPDPIMKIGMVCVSIIVVVFSVRAWVKHNKVLWAMFAFVATFMDTSFMLLATDVQSANSGIDTELVRLSSNEETAQKYLDSLRVLQLEKGEGYRSQIQDAIDAVTKAHGEKLAWMARPSGSGKVQMTADSVATAIPDAAMAGKWSRAILLVIFLTVFAGLQLTIISATGVKWNEKPNDHH